MRTPIRRIVLGGALTLTTIAAFVALAPACELAVNVDRSRIPAAYGTPCTLSSDCEGRCCCNYLSDSGSCDVPSACVGGNICL